MHRDLRRSAFIRPYSSGAVLECHYFGSFPTESVLNVFKFKQKLNFITKFIKLKFIF